MKVEIRDRDALESLTAAGFRAYLEANGWSYAGHWGERPIVIYGKEQDVRKWEVLVPLRDTASDYAESMAWAVATLADAEERSQLDVFTDLSNLRTDTKSQGNRKGAENMPNVWCIRAEHGEYTSAFVGGGYVGGGWFNEYENASDVTDREVLKQWFNESHPEVNNPYVIGAVVGMAFLFLREIQIGDYVITPAKESSQLWYGQVRSELYYESDPGDGCYFRHRRKVDWAEKPLDKSAMSIPFQNNMKAAKSAFAIKYQDEFWDAIDRGDLAPPTPQNQGYHRVVLDHVLKLDSAEFEMFVSQLLSALGFEDPEVVGKPGDGGVDVRGMLNVSNLAVVDIYVQAKRYKNKRVTAATVKKLRQVIPQGGQGAVVTTSDFGKGAREAAMEPGFPRIGLINGHQLVDLLIEHWDDIDQEFREMLGLKLGLVTA